jgi:hypothetical protein
MSATPMCEYRSAGSAAVSESAFRFQKRLRASIAPHIHRFLLYLPFVVCAKRRQMREKMKKPNDEIANKSANALLRHYTLFFATSTRGVRKHSTTNSNIIHIHLFFQELQQ